MPTFTLDISGLRDLAREAKPALARLVMARTTGATRTLVESLRADVVQAGLGRRLSNTWRGRVYPQGDASANAAGYVTNDAEDIVNAFEHGVTIAGKNGNWLAIPTANAPAARRNAGGGVKGGRRKATPREVEAIYNADLQLVPLDNGNALLVMPRAVRGRSGKGFRRATEGRVRLGRQQESVVMFLLVRQVRLKQRLTYRKVFDDTVAAWEAGLRADLDTLGRAL